MRRLIFGGTAEGRQLTEAYARAGDEVVVCVASGYAKGLLPEGVTCYDHPMDEAEMEAVARRHRVEEIVDATHPFAVLVTQNARSCAEALRLPYRRVERDSGRTASWRDAVQWVDSAQAAAQALTASQGPVLLTTGSHTLGVYLAALGPERLYARVLPSARVLAELEGLGMKPGHVIAMQGPFSQTFNGALYDQLGVRALVSKDSGEIGGVTDKVLPALSRGIQVILIKRPEE